MTTIVDREKLADVKTTMAMKYEALAKVAKSQGKRREFSHSAARYRLQAAKLISK